MNQRQLETWLADADIYGAGTLFCTEEYPVLRTSLHEVAPHPNLDPGNWREEIAASRKSMPSARSWRSHSLFMSQTISVELCRLGYDLVSVVEQFGDANPVPYRLPWGLWQMPIYYMDNSDFCNFNGMHLPGHRPFSPTLIESALTGTGLYVFDFHPIHLELNTPSYEFYAENRDRFRDGAGADELRYSGRGTRTFFNELNNAMRRHRMPSVTLCDALAQWIERRRGAA